MPRGQSLRARFQLPLGAIVHPLAGPQDDVPVIQLGPAGIVRCKRCRTYINPFMMWQDGGRCGAGLGPPVPAARLRPCVLDFLALQDMLATQLSLASILC